jgi:plasmid stabilization system protein ParE
VDEFRVTPHAFLDLDRLSDYLERKAGVRVAARVEARIFAAFDALVRLPWVGHRRKDMRQPELRFYRVYQYLIVFRREPRVVILRVVHGARDVERLLKKL